MTKNTPCTVVKDNALINASYNLNLVEQRLILLAIVRSRETGKGITANDYLDIHASDYINNFGSDKSSTYKSLRENSRNLFRREFSFIRNKQLIMSRWVSTIRYDDESATVSLIFAPEVISFISELEKHFTSYNLKDISGLTSAYAVRLYEIITCWKHKKQTPIIEIEELRQRLGIDVTEYVKMSNFKARVLDVGIKQINSFTNLTIKCEQHKKGRNIYGFSFTIHEKEAERDPNTIDWVDDKSKDKYITEGEFIELGKDGSDSYQIAVKAFKLGYKLPKAIQSKYKIEGDRFLQARKEAEKSTSKPNSSVAEFVLDDKALSNLKKVISKAINNDDLLTEEVKKSYIKVEVNETYEQITRNQRIIDVDGTTINENDFVRTLLKSFNIEVE